MKLFLWVFVIIFALDCIGKAIMLLNRDFTRKPALLVGDIAFNVLFLCWGAFLLGTIP
jgi:hypothetical protein